MSTEITAPSAPKRIAWTPLIWIGALHVGALLAFVPAFFSWEALGVCILLHWLTGGVGICMVYHRLLTHRSYAVRPHWLEYVLTTIGCCASEGGPIHWVADHRRHHAHSDEGEDVHTPLQGFAWAHMFWWATPEITSDHTPAYHARWAPDLTRDPVHVWIDRWHFIFPLMLAGLLFAIGGWPMLIWGHFVRSVLVLHTTWLVNSATHVWGYRTYQTRDHSTNLWWVALVTYGEGWHNNHHAFQTSARHGLRWWEVDMTYGLIRFLSWFKVVNNIKLAKTNRKSSLSATVPGTTPAEATAAATALPNSEEQSGVHPAPIESPSFGLSDSLAVSKSVAS